MEHKQNQPVFLINSIGRVDNLVDFSDEAPTTFDNLKDALEAAKSVAREYGLRTYVFKCIPVCRVDRGKIRVTKIGGKA